LKSKDSLALDFKSATLYALRVVLHDSDTGALCAALDQRMRDAGSFFKDEPVVIDAHALDTPPDWTALMQALRAHSLHPMGVTAAETMMAAAREAGLVSVELSASTPKAAVAETMPPADLAKPRTAAAPPPEDGRPAPAPAALVVDGPLRSGQRVYARATDLIVIGMVSQGAEVIADGNIHVYGPLRGKAMAGARGNTAARILTTCLEPELIAIAGVYRALEARLEPELHRRPALVQLEGDRLQLRALDG